MSFQSQFIRQIISITLLIHILISFSFGMVLTESPAATALASHRQSVKENKKILIIVEVPAASHINLLLGGARALVQQGYRVDFVAPDVYAAQLEAEAAALSPAGHFTYLPLPSTLTDSGFFQSFHSLYTSPNPGGEFEFLFKHFFCQAYSRTRPVLLPLLAQHRHDYAAILLDAFSNAASDLLRFDFPPPSSPPVLVSIPSGLGIFGFEAHQGLPTGFHADVFSADRSLATRWRDLTALFRVISATVANIPIFNALRASYGPYPPVSSPAHIFEHRPTLAFMYWDLDWARRLPPNVHMVGTMLNPYRPNTPADDLLLAQLDALAAANRSVVYIAFGSISYPTLPQLTQLVQGALAADPAVSVLVVIPSHSREAYLQQLTPQVDPARFLSATWVNQRRVLEHPVVKVFISHGGLMSLVESCAAATPMIVFPFYGDQPGNGVRLAERGAGFVVQQHHPQLRETIAAKVKILLSDPSYAAAAFRIDEYRVFLNPPQRFVEYLEEIILFGSDQLVPVTDAFSLIEIYNLDIFALFFTGLIIIVIFLFKIVRSICCHK